MNVVGEGLCALPSFDAMHSFGAWQQINAKISRFASLPGNDASGKASLLEGGGTAKP